jgi:hypothetical protein
MGCTRHITGIERCSKLPANYQQVKPKKIDKIVRGVCLYWIVFVITAWVTFWVKDSIPDTLIQFGLGGGAMELLVTGAIEIFRDKMNKEDKE